MAQTIGELVAFVRADNSEFERGLARSQLRMEGFTLDTAGRLRNLQGRFVTGSAVMQRALTGVGDEMGEVATQTVVYSSVVDRESRTMEARLRRVADAARSMGQALGERLGRVRAALSGFSVDTDRLGSMAGRLGGVAMSIGGIAAKLGAAVPLAAGLVGLVGQIAPAAGVAATGLFAVVLATQALKLGMKGVGDAVKAAMDPSNPAAFEEAIKKLAPNAQAFAREIKTLAPEFKKLQQGVQQRLFAGLGGIMREMGKTTLPVLKKGLFAAGDALNLMGKNIGHTAIGMSKSGVLGKALSGATDGLKNLSRVPSQIMLGLTQVGAAAAPAFRRLTDAAGKGADSFSEKISKAFESGAMQRAIDQAIVVIKQLGEIAGNVFSAIGSVFSAAQASGGGFLGVLKTITGSLADAFASPAVQGGLKAIFQTMAVLAQTIGPLLVMALKAVAPVFTALGPPIQRIITLLGAALGPIIGALGPVLEMAAVAVGALLDAVAPLLPVIGKLVAGLLPALTPLLALVANIFQRLAPVVDRLAQILMSTLAPILAALVPVIEPIADALLVLVDAILPILSAQMEAVAPLIAQLAQTFATLLVALAPVITQLLLLVARVLTDMSPALITAMGWVTKLAEILAGELGRVISTIVIPALDAIARLLAGDFSGAWAAAKVMVKGAIDYFVRAFIELPGRAGAALAGLAGALWARVQEAGGRMNEAARQKRDEFVAWIRGIPAAARGALGDLGGVLWSAGSRLIGGLIDGIRSKIGSLKGTLGGITSMIPSWKGPPETDAKLLTPAGRSLIEGFQRGITAATPGLQNQLGGLTGALPGMALGSAGAGGMAAAGGPTRLVVELAGPQEMKSLIRSIVQKSGGTVETVFGTR